MARIIEEDADGEALCRLVKYIANDPKNRRLEIQSGNQVWLKGVGWSCVWAPGFKRIIAPTYDSEFEVEL